MNIRNLTDSLPAAGAKTQPKSGAVTSSSASRTGGSDRTASADSVALSSTSRALKSAGQNDLPVDGAKVAALKSAIEDGSYKVDSKKIAGKLMEQQAELLQVAGDGKIQKGS